MQSPLPSQPTQATIPGRFDVGMKYAHDQPSEITVTSGDKLFAHGTLYKITKAELKIERPVRVGAPSVRGSCADDGWFQRRWPRNEKDQRRGASGMNHLYLDSDGDGKPDEEERLQDDDCDDLKTYVDGNDLDGPCVESDSIYKGGCGCQAAQGFSATDVAGWMSLLLMACFLVQRRSPCAQGRVPRTVLHCVQACAHRASHSQSLRLTSLN